MSSKKSNNEEDMRGNDVSLCEEGFVPSAVHSVVNWAAWMAVHSAAL